MRVRTRKISVMLVLVFSSFTTSLSHASSPPDEQWVQPSHAEDGFQGFLLQDARTQTGYSFLIGNRASSHFVCSAIDTGDCGGATSYGFNAVLPVCTSSVDTDCIDSLVAISPNGTRLQGTFSHYVWTKHPNQYVASKADGLPIGSAPSIWTIPGAEHSQISDYLITASIGGGGPVGKIDVSDFNLNLFASSIHQKLTPATFDTNPEKLAWMDFMNQRTDSDGITRTFGQGVGEYDSVKCASYLQDPMQCVVANPFPSNFSFEVKLRLSKEPNGWFHGRMSSPSISLAKSSNGSTLMTVQASPIKTPIIYFGAQFSTLPSNIQDLYKGCGAWPTCNFRSSRQPGQDGVGKKADPLTRNMTSNPQPWGLNAIKELQVWLPVIKNTATATPEVWSIHSVANDQMTSSNSCFSTGTGLLGIVSTNASAYSEGPPVFADGQLTYQVAAPHYMNDGNIFKGSYDLLMRSDVARCLYGFSSAPIKASIEVIDDSGSQSVATTSFSEVGGWDKLSAKNFEFSSPAINIKLAQDLASATPPATSSNQVHATSSNAIPKNPNTPKVITLNCYQGRIVKKVSGISPSCPRGFIKK